MVCGGEVRSRGQPTSRQGETRGGAPLRTCHQDGKVQVRRSRREGFRSGYGSGKTKTYRVEFICSAA